MEFRTRAARQEHLLVSDRGGTWLVRTLRPGAVLPDEAKLLQRSGERSGIVHADPAVTTEPRPFVVLHESGQCSPMDLLNERDELDEQAGVGMHVIVVSADDTLQIGRFATPADSELYAGLSLPMLAPFVHATTIDVSREQDEKATSRALLRCVLQLWHDGRPIYLLRSPAGERFELGFGGPGGVVVPEWAIQAHRVWPPPEEHADNSPPLELTPRLTQVMASIARTWPSGGAPLDPAPYQAALEELLLLWDDLGEAIGLAEWLLGAVERRALPRGHTSFRVQRGPSVTPLVDLTTKVVSVDLSPLEEVHPDATRLAVFAY